MCSIQFHKCVAHRTLMARNKYSRKKFLKKLPTLSDGMIKVTREGTVYLRKSQNKWIELNPLYDEGGFRVKYLYDNGKQKNHFIHRLVAEAYIPNPEQKPDVIFLDGDKSNPVVENLAWATKQDSKQHASQQKNNTNSPTEQSEAAKNPLLSPQNWNLPEKEMPASVPENTVTQIETQPEWANLPSVMDGIFRVSREGVIFRRKDDGGYSVATITPHKSGSGIVTCKINEKLKSFVASRLVAEAHVPNPDPENLDCVIFRNGDTKDLNADNLMWVSRSEIAVKRVQKTKTRLTEQLWQGLPEIENGTLRIAMNGTIYAREGNDFYEVTTNIRSSDEYKYVVVKINGREKRFGVHKLLAEAYVPNPNRCRFVGFHDRNHRNILIENLKWLSYEEVSTKEYAKCPLCEIHQHVRSDSMCMHCYNESKSHWSVQRQPTATKEERLQQKYVWSDLPLVAEGQCRVATDGTVYVRNGDGFEFKKHHICSGFKSVRVRDKKGKSKVLLVHRLLAEAYIAGATPNNFFSVSFKNGDKLDISLDNLILNNSNQTPSAKEGNVSTKQSETFVSCKPEWADLPELENGLLRVSRDGDVFIREGESYKKTSSHLAEGYPAVYIVRDGKRYRMYVHRLVAFAHVPNSRPNEANLVSFINGLEAGINADNLEWLTQSEVSAKSRILCPVCKKNNVLSGRNMCNVCKQSEKSKKRKNTEQRIAEETPQEPTTTQPFLIPLFEDTSEREADNEKQFVNNALLSGLIRPSGREDSAFSRDFEILQMRADGVGVEVIAEEFALTTSRVTQIINSRTLIYKVFVSASGKTA